MPRSQHRVIVAALAVSLAVVCVSTIATANSNSHILGSALRAGARLNGPGMKSMFKPFPAQGMASRSLAASALDGQTFADVDYRKFGSAYDGYRSILKTVKGMYGKELKAYLDEGYALLDVRPEYEVERIRPSDSTHIGLIYENKDVDLGAFARKWTNTIYAGHSRDLKRNDNFVADVQKVFPADTKLVLVCGEGLRSLIATKQLVDAGYKNVLWLAAGLQGVPLADIPSEGSDVNLGYARAGLDGGKIANEIFDKVTSFRWWELGKGEK
mmetsp:Transcript_24862/g.44232  ORF Transcript_24862/g.44232 Transcript_24862/m.44232 type:complete len:270 (-) Transcript_24862:290-1099(-)|eukprot:CAMPEP_0197514786 /NCGR_PEP_ID=MMETSP1318-20131121/119_1 /TAXON_ID=552666 /ORGANISM="Partenskyella glossopodia, Strain RCC365" /LENGTH=269 /DNA_ID=CAMNT_0043062975 /DNA_START=153 /DNA_END=962 /DNA_ORIENTATION=-